ncbi:MAG: Yip1 family protein [Candidatus Thorarchaeota archaeon]
MRRCEFCDSPVPADATTCPVCKEQIAEETLERILPLLKRPDAPEVRVMGPMTRLWGVIRRPSAAYRDIGQKPDFFGPLMIIVANALVFAGFIIAISSRWVAPVVINASSLETADSSILFTSEGSGVFLLAASSLLPNILLGMIYLVVGSAFAHLAFKISGGLGNRSKTASIVGYSMLPVVLFRLIGILLVFVFVEPAQFSTVTPLYLDQAIYQNPMWLTLDYMTTAAFIWSGFLLIFGIREAHNTSTQWAVVIAIACILVLTWTFWQAHP